MFSIGLRYCGGCNPEIDRTGLIDRLKEALKRSGLRVAFVTDKAKHTDMVLLINGCKHACLEQGEAINTIPAPVISIRGEMVGNQYIQERDIPDALMENIMEMAPPATGSGS